MKFNSLIIFLLVFSAQSTLASEFKLTNKNLNTLAALICQSDNKSAKKNHALGHKISIVKNKTGKTKHDEQFEVSGTCNINYNLKTNKIVDFGEEFYFEIDAKKLSSSNGKYGIKDIQFSFSKGRLIDIKIIDSLMLTKQKLKLSHSKWAINDSILSFSKSNLISLKISRKIAAVEKNSVLNFKTKKSSKFYNIWSFESFGCSSKKSISETKCEKIINSLK